MFRLVLLILTGLLVAANLIFAILGENEKVIPTLIGTSYSVAVFYYIYTH